MITPHRRRWLFPSVLGLAALLALTVIGIAIYTADPVRVVALLQKALRRDFGLALRYEGRPHLQFWPHPGVALEDYRIDVVATRQPLAWGDALAIEVPWRALTGGELAIERIALDGPVINAGAAKGWTRSAGDEAALRWPDVGNGIVVRDGTITNFGDPPRTITGIEIELSPVAPRRALSARIAWRIEAEGEMASDASDEDAQPVVLEIAGTPKNPGADPIATGLGLSGPVLDDAQIALRVGDAPPITWRGTMTFAPAGWALDGTIEAAKLPAGIAAYVVAPATEQPRTSVVMRLTRQPERWTLLARGTLGSSTIDADLRFDAIPDLSAPLPELLETARRDIHGSATMTRLQLGDVVLENISFGDDEPAQR